MNFRNGGRMNILVSACLLGVHCRYDGNGVLQEGLEQLSKKHHLIPVVPVQTAHLFFLIFLHSVHQFSSDLR